MKSVLEACMSGLENQEFKDFMSKANIDKKPDGILPSDTMVLYVFSVNHP